MTFAMLQSTLESSFRKVPDMDLFRRIVQAARFHPTLLPRFTKEQEIADFVAQSLRAKRDRRALQFASMFTILARIHQGTMTTKMKYPAQEFAYLGQFDSKEMYRPYVLANRAVHNQRNPWKISTADARAEYLAIKYEKLMEKELNHLRSYRHPSKK